jgi:hypothetical protein
MIDVHTARPTGALARFLPIPAFAALYLALGFVTRLVLWVRFGTVADVPAADLPALLAAGIVNDAVESLYLLAPLAVFLLVTPDRWMRRPVVQGLLTVGSVATIALLVYLGAAEVYFFEEFDARFNLVAFDYLAYPTEVFVDIWEAYPVFKVLIGTLVLASGLAWLLRRWWTAGTSAIVPLRARAVPFAAFSVALLAAVAWTRPTRCPGPRTGSRTRSCRTATAASSGPPRPTRSTTTPITHRATLARISSCSRTRSNRAADGSPGSTRGGWTGNSRPARTVSAG